MPEMTMSSNVFFDELSKTWDDHYQGQIHYLDRLFVLRNWLKQRIYAVPGAAKALDVGCGTGVAMAVYGAGKIPVVGIDVSQAMLEKAKSKGYAETHLIAGAKLPVPDGEFSVGHMFNVIEFVPEPKELFGEIRRALKPGAYFLLNFCNMRAARSLASQYKRVLFKQPRYGHPELKHTFTFETLKAALEESGFTEVAFHKYSLMPGVNKSTDGFLDRFTRNRFFSDMGYVECRKA